MAQDSSYIHSLFSGVLGSDLRILHKFCLRRQFCACCFNGCSFTMRCVTSLPTHHGTSRPIWANKKIVFVMVLTALLLSAAIGALSAWIVISGRRSLHNGGGWMSSTKGIHLACNTTLYPALCVSTLLSYPGVGLPYPKGFVQITFSVTMDRLQQAYATALNVATQGMASQEHTALEDCMELLQDSIDHLHFSLVKIAGMNGKPLQNEIADVQTWLSAALTNQETCLDGFREAGGDIKDELEERSQHLSKLLSNALAMIKISFPENNMETNVFRVPNPLANRRRPVMAENKECNEGLPAWLSVADRRLLQAPNAGVLLANMTVAQDGSGQYNTIAEAVKKAPSHSRERYVIYVKKGVYKENVDVSKKTTNLMLVGDGRWKTIVVSNRNVKNGSTTFRSATFAASGKGFIARDMSFSNSAGPGKHQAVALRVGADFSAIYRCNIFGYQDSLYVYSLRQFYRECNIYGTVDIIFGNAAVVFQKCNIIVRRPLANQKNTITAHGRNDPNQNTGISIQNCRVVAGRDLIPAKRSFPTYLGRPWMKYSRTVFIQTFLDDLIHPAGWLELSGNYALKSLYYGEYMNTGPGAKVDKRVSWDGYRVIQSAEEANNFTVANLISGCAWLPSTGISFIGGLIQLPL